MSTSTYSYKTTFDGDFDTVEQQIRNALQTEGFGVLTEIDVQATLKNKLDVGYPKYKILGTCNPLLAYKSLQAEPDIGLLLPCNVVIYEDKHSQVTVAAVLPSAMLSVVDHPAIGEIAGEVEEKLIKVIKSL